MRNFDPDEFEYDDVVDEVDSAINGQHPRNFANRYGRGSQEDHNPYRRRRTGNVPVEPDDGYSDWQFDCGGSDDELDDGAYELDDGQMDPEAAALHYDPEENRGAIHAYNADFEKSAAYKAQQRRSSGKKKPRPDRRDGSGRKPPRREAPPTPRRRSRHPILKLILVLLLLLAVAVAALWIFAKQPESDQGLGERKPGCTSILLAGTDADGMRTDTMMLLYLDEKNRQMSLLSLPRDTYTSSGTSVPKLNSIYGMGGCGEAGMDLLMDYVVQCVGYRPDGYVLIDMDCFSELVNLMGGIEFDVPMDMEVSENGVTTVLAAGMQQLDGTQALAVVRFRSGYAMADLERINVQRNFISAALDQWLSVKNLIKAPSAAHLISSNTITDLSLGNLVWLAKTVKLIGTGNMQTNTLPGEPAYVGDGSYYILYPQASADLVNESYNPYETPVSSERIYSPYY